MFVVGTYINLRVCQTLNATKVITVGLHPHSYVSHAVTSKRYAQNVNNEYLVTDSTPSVHHWPSNSSSHSIPSIRNNNYHLPSSISTNLINKIIIINSSRFAKTHSHVHILLSLLGFYLSVSGTYESFFGGCFCLQSIASLSLAAASLALRQIIKLN